jgi:hypothetical protein
MTDRTSDLIAASRVEERQSRELLTTSDCARLIGMTGEFIRGEIREGRLKSRAYHPSSRRRAKYRIERADFVAYMEQHWPRNP